MHAVKANEPWLARMTEDHDDISLGLTLDAYMTEYHHPGSATMTEVVNDLTAHRGAGERKALARSLLLGGFRFGATHLERHDPNPGSTVLLGAGRHVSRIVQERLVGHVVAGGNLVLLGPLPERDLDGSPCLLLAEALGLTAGVVRRDQGHYFPSLVAHGWAAPWPAMRAGWMQQLTHDRGDVVLTDVEGAVCGVDVPLGRGRAVVLAAQLPSSPALFTRALDALGVRPGLRLESQWPGVFATTTSTDDGQRALHLINTSGSSTSVTVALDGTAIADGVSLSLPARSGHVLPLGLEIAGRRFDWVSAEFTGLDDRGEPVFGVGLDPDGATTVMVDGQTMRLTAPQLVPSR